MDHQRIKREIVCDYEEPEIFVDIDLSSLKQEDPLKLDFELCNDNIAVRRDINEFELVKRNDSINKSLLNPAVSNSAIDKNEENTSPPHAKVYIDIDIDESSVKCEDPSKIDFKPINDNFSVKSDVMKSRSVEETDSVNKSFLKIIEFEPAVSNSANNEDEGNTSPPPGIVCMVVENDCSSDVENNFQSQIKYKNDSIANICGKEHHQNESNPKNRVFDKRIVHEKSFEEPPIDESLSNGTVNDLEIYCENFVSDYILKYESMEEQLDEFDFSTTKSVAVENKLIKGSSSDKDNEEILVKSLSDNCQIVNVAVRLTVDTKSNDDCCYEIPSLRLNKENIKVNINDNAHSMSKNILPTYPVTEKESDFSMCDKSSTICLNRDDYSNDSNKKKYLSLSPSPSKIQTIDCKTEKDEILKPILSLCSKKLKNSDDESLKRLECNLKESDNFYRSEYSGNKSQKKSSPDISFDISASQNLKDDSIRKCIPSVKPSNILDFQNVERLKDNSNASENIHQRTVQQITRVQTVEILKNYSLSNSVSKSILGINSSNILVAQNDRLNDSSTGCASEETLADILEISESKNFEKIENSSRKENTCSDKSSSYKVKDKNLKTFDGNLGSNSNKKYFTNKILSQISESNTDKANPKEKVSRTTSDKPDSKTSHENSSTNISSKNSEHRNIERLTIVTDKYCRIKGDSREGHSKNKDNSSEKPDSKTSHENSSTNISSKNSEHRNIERRTIVTDKYCRIKGDSREGHSKSKDNSSERDHRNKEYSRERYSMSRDNSREKGSYRISSSNRTISRSDSKSRECSRDRGSRIKDNYREMDSLRTSSSSHRFSYSSDSRNKEYSRERDSRNKDVSRERDSGNKSRDRDSRGISRNKEYSRERDSRNKDVSRERDSGNKYKSRDRDSRGISHSRVTFSSSSRFHRTSSSSDPKSRDRLARTSSLNISCNKISDKSSAVLELRYPEKTERTSNVHVAQHNLTKLDKMSDSEVVEVLEDSNEANCYKINRSCRSVDDITYNEHLNRLKRSNTCPVPTSSDIKNFKRLKYSSSVVLNEENTSFQSVSDFLNRPSENFEGSSNMSVSQDISSYVNSPEISDVSDVEIVDDFTDSDKAKYSNERLTTEGDCNTKRLSCKTSSDITRIEDFNKLRRIPNNFSYKSSATSSGADIQKDLKISNKLNKELRPGPFERQRLWLEKQKSLTKEELVNAELNGRKNEWNDMSSEIHKTQTITDKLCLKLKDSAGVMMDLKTDKTSMRRNGPGRNTRIQRLLKSAKLNNVTEKEYEYPGLIGKKSQQNDRSLEIKKTQTILDNLRLKLDESIKKLNELKRQSSNVSHEVSEIENLKKMKYSSAADSEDGKIHHKTSSNIPSRCERTSNVNTFVDTHSFGDTPEISGVEIVEKFEVSNGAKSKEITQPSRTYDIRQNENFNRLKGYSDITKQVPKVSKSMNVERLTIKGDGNKKPLISETPCDISSTKDFDKLRRISNNFSDKSSPISSANKKPLISETPSHSSIKHFDRLRRISCNFLNESSPVSSGNKKPLISETPCHISSIKDKSICSLSHSLQTFMSRSISNEIPVNRNCHQSSYVIPLQEGLPYLTGSNLSSVTNPAQNLNQIKSIVSPSENCDGDKIKMKKKTHRAGRVRKLRLFISQQKGLTQKELEDAGLHREKSPQNDTSLETSKTQANSELCNNFADNVKKKIVCQDNNVLETAFNYHKDSLTTYSIEEDLCLKLNEMKDYKKVRSVLKLVENLCSQYKPLTPEILNFTVVSLRTCAKKTVSELFRYIICNETQKPFEGAEISLTSLQRYLFVIIYHLVWDSEHPDLLEEFMKSVKSALFREPAKSLELSYKNLIRFTSLLCRSMQCFCEMRWFIYDILYMLQNNAMPLIHTIISQWPRLLDFINNEDCPLSFYISHLIFSYRSKRKGDLDYENFMKILSHRKINESYRYKLNEMTSDDVFENLFKLILKEGFAEAMILLCKREGSCWTIKKIKTKFLPTLNSWRNGFVEDKVSATIISILGFIIRLYSQEEALEVFQEIAFHLEHILLRYVKSTSTAVQEAAAITICNLIKFNFELCVNIFRKWKPKNGEISEDVIEAMKFMISEKKPIWWQRYFIN